MRKLHHKLERLAYTARSCPPSAARIAPPSPGVILGGALLAALPEVLRHVVEPLQMTLFGKILIEAEVLRQLLYGLAMVLIMLNRPAGLWPAPKHEDRPDANKDTA